MYNNITISGLPGTGTTTLLRELENRLPNWKCYSGGEFMRQFSGQKNKLHHDATQYGDDVDKQHDYKIREMLSTKKHFIIESWLSGFMAQQISGTLKILLVCNDDVRVDRVSNRDEVTVFEAKKHVFDREKNNVDKWSRLYKKEWETYVSGGISRFLRIEKINFWREDLYDLVIDTYSNSKEETVEKVMFFLD